MSDEQVEFSVIMQGIDDGLKAMLDADTNSLDSYHSSLANMASAEAAIAEQQKLIDTFFNLTEEEKAALIANEEYKQSLASMQEEAIGINESFSESKDVVGQMNGAMTEANATMMIAQQAIVALKQGYDATVGGYQTYIGAVREVSAISGQSSEQTGQFISLLKQYGVSLADVTTAARKLNSEGQVPSIDTLATLSDKYLSLTDAQQKNDLVLKNLGRSGFDYIQILSMGSAAIKEQASAIDGALAPSAAAMAQSEALRESQVRLNESWEKLSITVGSDLVPAFASFTDNLNGFMKGFDIVGGLVNGTISPLKLLGTEFDVVSQSISDFVSGKGGVKEVAAATESLKGAAKETSASMLATAQALEGVKSAASGASTATASMSTQTTKLTADQESLAIAVRYGAQQLADLNGHITGGAIPAYGSLGMAIDIAKTKQDALVAAQKTALAEMNAAQEGLGKEATNSLAAWNTSTGAIVDSLNQSLRPAILGYTNDLNNIPTTKTTVINSQITPPATGGNAPAGQSVGGAGTPSSNSAQSPAAQGQVGANTFIIYADSVHFDSQGSIV